MELVNLIWNEGRKSWPKESCTKCSINRRYHNYVWNRKLLENNFSQNEIWITHAKNCIEICIEFIKKLWNINWPNHNLAIKNGNQKWRIKKCRIRQSKKESMFPRSSHKVLQNNLHNTSVCKRWDFGSCFNRDWNEKNYVVTCNNSKLYNQGHWCEWWRANPDGSCRELIAEIYIPVKK